MCFHRPALMRDSTTVICTLQARGANILAEYLGGGITCDAYHMTDPRADGLGVSTCIEIALADAGIEREQARPPSHPCLLHLL